MPARKTPSSPARKKSVQARKKARPAAAGSRLLWEDDPRSGVPPTRRRPADAAASLPFRISTPAPAGAGGPGTRSFRWWTAQDALSRGTAFWAPLLPAGRSWQPGGTLPIHLEAGEDLNAYYDRASLSFFVDRIGTRAVYSGASPDIVLHELGHAILDILRPQLWDVTFIEAAAFHESFGDISSLLAGLCLPSLAAAILRETGGELRRSSRLSRIGEELGWAIRRRHPQLAEPDCLRNASNSLFYIRPSQLAPTGPDSILTAEPHNYSRVFTGGFLDALAAITRSLAGSRAVTPEHCAEAARTAAALLANAVGQAAITSRYYRSVAAQMVALAGPHSDSVAAAFKRRGILPLDSSPAAPPAATARRAVRSSAAAREAAVDAREVVTTGSRFGLGALRLAFSGGGGNVAARSAGGVARAAEAPDEDSEQFLSYLFMRGRITATDAAETARLSLNLRARKTHLLEPQAGGVRLRRIRFDCGFD
jgi:hypothetical protein